jgi:hypothetical protein
VNIDSPQNKSEHKSYLTPRFAFKYWHEKIPFIKKSEEEISLLRLFKTLFSDEWEAEHEERVYGGVKGALLSGRSWPWVTYSHIL